MRNANPKCSWNTLAMKQQITVLQKLNNVNVNEMNKKLNGKIAT